MLFLAHLILGGIGTFLLPCQRTPAAINPPHYTAVHNPLEHIPTEPTMLFFQSAGVFFLAFVLSRFLLPRPPTAAEILLCSVATAILWLLRLLVQRVSSELPVSEAALHRPGHGG